MDVRSYVTSTRFVVIVAAIVLAIPTSYGVYELTGNYPLSFLAMFTIGVSVPQIYSRSWPDSYDRLHGIAWTVGACTATLAVVLVGFVLLNPFLSEFATAVGAFLLAQLAIAGVSRALERGLLESTDDGDDATDDTPQ